MPGALPLAAEVPSRPLVLLVEDEVLVRTTLANMLELNDFRVIPVANADEALEILEAVPGIHAVVRAPTASRSSRRDRSSMTSGVRSKR